MLYYNIQQVLCELRTHHSGQALHSAQSRLHDKRQDEQQAGFLQLPAIGGRGKNQQ